MDLLALYHTQQAILIGSSCQVEAEHCSDERVKLDCRRFKKYLKDTLKYETTLLENPNIDTITEAIEKAKHQMQFQCKLLLYFSGTADRYHNEDAGVSATAGLKVHLNND